MMQREFSPKICEEISKGYPDDFGIDYKEWLGNPENVCLRENNTLGFAERTPWNPDIWYIHFISTDNDLSGKERKEIALDMVKEMWYNYGVKALLGPIYKTNKKAQVFARAIGMKKELFDYNDEMYLYSFVSQPYGSNPTL